MNIRNNLQRTIEDNEIPVIRNLSHFQAIKTSDDVIFSIFSKLRNGRDLEKCSLVCKNWQKKSKEVLLTKNIFAENQWELNIGKPGNADGSPLPSLSVEFHKILKRPCPIWQGKIIGETHSLILFPEMIDENLLTLNSFAELLKNKFKTIEGFGYILSKISEEHGDKPIGKSCWVLMPRKILPGSRNESFSLQEQRVKTLAKVAASPYKIPELLPAAFCLFAMYCTWGTHFFSKELTRCQEVTKSAQVAIGLYDKEGPRIYNTPKDSNILGISPIWNLSLNDEVLTSEEILQI